MDLLTYGQGEDVDLPGLRIIRIPAFNSLGKVKTDMHRGREALKRLLADDHG